MACYVFSDDSAMVARVRIGLGQHGFECQPQHVTSLAQALTSCARSLPGQVRSGSLAPAAMTAADWIFLVLPADVEAGLRVFTELHAVSPARLLVIGPATDSKFVLRVMRMGASEYLDAADMETELSAALDRLRQELAMTGKIAPLLTLMGVCGGCGASTLAVNLAVAIAKKHGQCGLLDLKLKSGDLAPLLDLKPNHTLADLGSEYDRLDPNLVEGAICRHASGIGLLAAPQSIADASYVSSEALGRLLPIVRRMFPFVVTDVDNQFNEYLMGTLQDSALVMLVLRLEFAALRATRRVVEFLRDLGVSAERIRLVVNRSGQPSEVLASKAELAMDQKIWQHIPDDPRSVIRANNQGLPLITDAPSAKVTRSIIEWADKIDALLNRP